ncbi:MAG: cell division protein SepF [Thermoleophilia bacterium]
MGLAELWNRTLVYFGLAEDYDDAWDDDLSEEEDARPVYPERSSTNVRRLVPRRRRDDDFDDWTVAEPRASLEPDGAQAVTPRLASRRRGRPVEAVPAAAAPAQVHLVLPRSFNDAQQIADKLKQSIPVIVNLQSADQELSKRLIDFSSGLTYALNGSMQRVADKVFLLTPVNVEVSAEERARALERGTFFNQA